MDPRKLVQKDATKKTSTVPAAPAVKTTGTTAPRAPAARMPTATNPPAPGSARVAQNVTPAPNTKPVNIVKAGQPPTSGAPVQRTAPDSRNASPARTAAPPTSSAPVQRNTPDSRNASPARTAAPPTSSAPVQRQTPDSRNASPARPSTASRSEPLIPVVPPPGPVQFGVGEVDRSGNTLFSSAGTTDSILRAAAKRKQEIIDARERAQKAKKAKLPVQSKPTK